MRVVSLYDDLIIFFFQAEDGIRDLVRSRGLGDVYKRQVELQTSISMIKVEHEEHRGNIVKLASMKKKLQEEIAKSQRVLQRCLLYTSDAADERSSVDLGGRRTIKKKTI